MAIPSMGLEMQSKNLIILHKFSYRKITFYLANIFAFTPIFNRNFTNFKYEKQHKIYTAMVMILIVIGFFIREFGQFTVYKTHKIHSEVYVNAAHSLLVTIFLLFVISVSVFKYREQWLRLFSTFKIIDNDIKFTCSNKAEIVRLLCIILGHFLYFFIIFLEAYILLDHRTYIYFLLVRCRVYIVFIAVTVIAIIALEIKDRIKCFNAILTCYFQAKYDSITLTAIEIAYKRFHNVNTLIDCFNTLFGWQVVLLFGIMLTGLLESLNGILIYYIFKENDDHPNKYTFSFIRMFLNVCVSSLILTWGVIVIVCCGGANDEAYRTATICYQLISELPEGSPEAQKLLVLAQHASHRCPQLTAANVFTVNIAALFTLLGSLTSYVIVLIQFDKQ